MSQSPQDQALQQTALHALHVELGAEMVPFAGYDMPVRYPMGIMAEHLHCREKAALFDVSHMGQFNLAGDDAVAELEKLVPGDINSLKTGRMRYSLLLNEQGGILDDLMITRGAKDLFIVVNAACKDADEAHMRAHLAGDTRLTKLDDRALLALQGPQAANMMGQYDAKLAQMPFMSGMQASLDGLDCFVSRCGYTGEDGYEISVANDQAEDLARALLAFDDVEPVGLGARDTLRLEAGLCLYGSDIDTNTTPIEASLTWTIGKRRKIEKDFPGAGPIMDQLFDGPSRLRVGIRPDGRAPARAHTEILDLDGNIIGEITSGGYGPTVGGPVAMGYVDAAFANDGTEVGLNIRNKVHKAHIAPMPFIKKGWK
ncbi:MAG: glycine cleavage system aminomethyltransferase GcvT [Alphaproteobacteria bacterium]|nr:MAG: glycine cleavage system aminomethyltransferase GcvT [Alphaproteobacteria bacterium]